MSDDVVVPGQMDLLDEIPRKHTPRVGDPYRVRCQDADGAPWEGVVTLFDVVELHPDGGRRWRVRYERPGATPGHDFENIQVVVGANGHALDGTASPA